MVSLDHIAYMCARVVPGFPHPRPATSTALPHGPFKVPSPSFKRSAWTHNQAAMHSFGGSAVGEARVELSTQRTYYSEL